MPNPRRGDVVGKVGSLELHLRVSFDRIARAEQVVGKSCLTLAVQMGNGEFPPMLQVAAFLHAMSTKPKVDINDLKRELAQGGLQQGLVLIGKVVVKFTETATSDDDDDEADLPDDDDDEGKTDD